MEIATIKFPGLKRFYIFYISPSIEALRYCDLEEFLEYREHQRIEGAFQTKDIEFRKENTQQTHKEVKEIMELYLENSNSLWRLLYDDNIDFDRLERLGFELLDLQLKIKEYESHPLADSSTTKLILDFRQFTSRLEDLESEGRRRG